MSEAPPSPERRDRCRSAIDRWSASLVADGVLVGLEKVDADGPLWLIRLPGTSRDICTVRLRLDQRTLVAELYLVPAPPADDAPLCHFALQRNAKLRGIAYARDSENGFLLTGARPVEQIDAEVLDHLVGSLFEESERAFPTLFRLGWSTP